MSIRINDRYARGRQNLRIGVLSAYVLTIELTTGSTGRQNVARVKMGGWNPKASLTLLLTGDNVTKVA